MGGLGITREEAEFGAIWLGRRGSDRRARFRRVGSLCDQLSGWLRGLGLTLLYLAVRFK